MPDYIIEPFDTDVETIYQDFVDYVRGFHPDWNPSEAQIDVIIARFFAQQTATIADMGSRVQRSIYRYLGAHLENIPPLPGSPAQATISFHIVDGLAHILPLGTLVALKDANGDTFTFQTLEELVVAEGAPEWQNVASVATELGAAGNNLTGTVEMLEQFDWIDEAQVSGASSGGSDPEEDDIYIQRLTDNLSIPRRPALANDLVIMARNVPGVWRAAAIDNYRDTGGGTYATDKEDSVAISAVDADGQVVTGTVLDQLMSYLVGNLRQNFDLEFVPPSYNTIHVTYTAHGYDEPGYSAASVESEVNDSLELFLSPARSGMVNNDIRNRSWKVTQTMRYLELTTIVENNRHIDYVETLTFAVNAGPSNTANKALAGPFSLTEPGVIDGTILIP